MPFHTHYTPLLTTARTICRFNSNTYKTNKPAVFTTGYNTFVFADRERFELSVRNRTLDFQSRASSHSAIYILNYPFFALIVFKKTCLNPDGVKL